MYTMVENKVFRSEFMPAWMDGTYVHHMLEHYWTNGFRLVECRPAHDYCLGQLVDGMTYVFTK